MILQSFFDLISKLFFFTSYIAKESYPKPLSPEDEAINIELAINGDNKAKDTLIRHNLRLVAHIAKKYSSGADLDDYISVGSIGLVKGINTYARGKGTALATYLAKCIENEILMMLRSNKRYKNTVYLQEGIGKDSEGNEYSLMDVLSIKEENVFKQIEIGILRDRLDEIMQHSLTPREYDIIKMRFGLGNSHPLTQLEVATKLNISRSYISRIETKALSKIRGQLNKDDFF